MTGGIGGHWGAELRGRAGGADRPKEPMPENLEILAGRIRSAACSSDSEKGFISAHRSAQDCMHLIADYLENVKIAQQRVSTLGKAAAIMLEHGPSSYSDLPRQAEAARQMLSDKKETIACFFDKETVDCLSGETEELCALIHCILSPPDHKQEFFI